MASTFDHFVLTAADVEATLAFYRDVCRAELRDLEAWRAGEAEYPVLHFGEWKINVHPAGRELSPVATAAAPGTVDVCLRWTDPTTSAEQHLARHRVALELGPIPQEGARGHGTSVYFRDPDGNLVEFITYHEPGDGER
jgi:catechol 2,3-dioxygenase-like lactoylglutathione lyase family enzyme